MNNSNEAFDAVIVELDNLKKNLKRKKTKQIQSFDERALLKATALSWFNNHRAKLNFDNSILSSIDESFHLILASGDKSSSRNLIQKEVKELKASLIKLRKQAFNVKLPAKPTSDQPPDFSSLISDQGMKDVLDRRWNECAICVLYNAPLAATVMIGGLLEGLLIAKINQEPEQSKIYKSKSAPLDKKSLKPKPLSEWMLSDIINLAHELRWISKPAKDISSVLREYRNYIHPHKEFVNKINLVKSDASLFWEITKSITRQLLND